MLKGRQALAASLPRVVFWLFLALVCAQVVFRSWIEEDAFITFRVVDNFVHGFGLRWNVNERVQSYTNPLWMLLHVPLHAVLDDIALSTWILCWGCLVGTLWIVRRTFEFEPVRMTALFLVPILVSPTLTLFFTSGLETPLLTLLFAGFGRALVDTGSPRRWLLLSLFTALSAFTRLDTLVFYAPIWLWLLHGNRGNVRWRQVFLGSAPLVCWLSFSLFYYGFVLPNTALAKLHTGLPLSDYLVSGLAYTLDFLVADPWIAGLTVAAAVWFPVQAWRQRRGDDTGHGPAAAVAVAVALYCLYVIYVGGYQLGLRMSSLPAFAACWLWLWRLPVMSNARYACVALAAVLVQAVISQPPEERAKIPFIAGHEISGVPLAQYLFVPDEAASLRYRFNPDVFTRRPERATGEPRVVATGAIGQFGYYSGPGLIIIDPFALSDPLLARLPSAAPHLERVSHIKRAAPRGYVEAVATGSTSNMAPSLRQYYEKLRLITQGDLFSPARLATIVRFNLGEYEKWREDYIAGR